LAYQQLMYSYSAYCNSHSVANFSCYWCLYKPDTHGFIVTNLITNESTNTFGFVGYTNNSLQLSFRGTQPASLLNWLTDIEAGKTEPYPNIPNALVHSGFYRAYEGVRTQVQQALKGLISKNPQFKQIHITGHSLGGALAVVCALDLIESSFPLPITVYTFGEPRVGNIYFAQYFDAHIPDNWRVVNKADLVPHVPDELMGFHHISTEVWYKTTATYEICNGSGEDPKCSDSLLLYYIPDHWTYLNTDITKACVL